MIEGLKFKVSSEELKQHCSERSKYHDQRARDKQLQLPELEKMLEQIKSGGGAAAASVISKSGYNMDPRDTVEALQKDISDHQSKSRNFAFFAEHLFDDVYQLKQDDLVALEITKRW